MFGNGLFNSGSSGGASPPPPPPPPPSEIISADANNAISLGTDEKLFVQPQQPQQWASSNW